ncbi:glutamate synthase-related protein [Rhodococcus sp. 14-2470-1a]|uniref:glutamate synthase-related protein n=1 Tax=Rhodococcus sp. 14-2470-1a TaxID=2023150 RepID=UPI000B9B7EEE|nr:glutamate synthase-related protein [Rhodococcus sp. 14-2470-1a]OZF51581.1 glutamate synthase large subunit [Rhodococcus sp. 14-2470-1a]
MHEKSIGLYDPSLDSDSCGVGFITRKDGVQSHDVLIKAREALCSVPHRGGMSAEGVGDGGGVSLDLSVDFFRRVTDRPTLELGRFAVGNFFLPDDESQHARAVELIHRAMIDRGFTPLTVRDVPVNNDAIRPAAVKYQRPVRQWIWEVPRPRPEPAAIDRLIHEALLHIESIAYTTPTLAGLYPLSLSARTQVLKGRLNSDEVIPYFCDLVDPEHSVHTIFFHTRFSTNTDPHPTMAQPFRFMAHNGELNTDKKNRLAEAAVASAKRRAIVRPPGQSDSCRLDQTVQARVVEDNVELVTAVVSMMPPAWENDYTLSPRVRAMFEYFSLYEEKNDGPAAVVFGDGTVIGARLDRLGLRPLRTVETNDYLCAFSEAGQVRFPPETITHRGRVEAGGMIYFDHRDKHTYYTREAFEKLAADRDYTALLAAARVGIDDLDAADSVADAYAGDLERHQRYVAYSLDQESFKFLMDPMLASGVERVSAMGYGNAINALTDREGGMAKYFSQRFAQVTNPPLDSIREADGMTLRVSLGPKPNVGGPVSRQVVVPSPLLSHTDLRRITEQPHTPVARFDMTYRSIDTDSEANERALVEAVNSLADSVVRFARDGGIAVLSDRDITRDNAALPVIAVVAFVNERLIAAGVRLRVSLVVESGQISSSHHVALVLGFGAAAVHPLTVRLRAEDKFGADPDVAFAKFVKAAEKSLMKTMGRVGLCTVESYIGGEFFEPNFLDTSDPVLSQWFPNMKSPVGGVGFRAIAAGVAHWHAHARSAASESDLPNLGLFKERADGAGHSFGATSVRGFVDMTKEKIAFAGTEADATQTDALRLLTITRLGDAFGLGAEAYASTSFDRLTDEQIDAFEVTGDYRSFVRSMHDERSRRPAALRDVLATPADVSDCSSAQEFALELGRFDIEGNTGIVVRGLQVDAVSDTEFALTLRTDPARTNPARAHLLGDGLGLLFGDEATSRIDGDTVIVTSRGRASLFLGKLGAAPASIPLSEVQKASAITPLLASGAMSHGALNANAHEAVAHGTNMVGAMSNSGEGGEHLSRYGTVRASRIKQFASGRFGIWAGYLADPMLEEIEIKIGQGAKPGEGGQLPAPKVTVDIAAARSGTPGVELVSPPPHHDTYSIEDLAQLIHDCKAARVRVIVKLVSSEGIGTIAVGVAKAGADVINIAGNTGGTGAASVTSLKYAGRAAEIGLAEVHQALCANGLRQKVILRCSGAHQTGRDVVTSALLGGDSFEFGTTALMMMGCVMAKNCNVKCPAGLTTNPEVFDGDPRSMAQYLLNIAHEVRELLAELGMPSLRHARGRTDLLHLVDHAATVGALDLHSMLTVVRESVVTDPVYLEREYGIDDMLMAEVRTALIDDRARTVAPGGRTHLGNLNKSVGGQLSIDIERLLNHELPTSVTDAMPSVLVDDRGRRYLAPGTALVSTYGAAGLSFAAFCNDGVVMDHTGTCNDGVGKSMNGGTVIVRSPGGGSPEAGGNVLIGNFALFGATGGRAFVEGESGDRFGVRNSGATAVVEGVGDFAAEYMTGGAILNLGGFGKGVCNGMSGGFFYQYDPNRLLPLRASADSVILGSITADDEQAAIHTVAVRMLLEWHVEATGSASATRLLQNWEVEQHRFVYAMPRALLLYQDSDAILAAKTRKELLDELAGSLATQQVRSYKLSLREGTPVLGGSVPGYGETDTDTVYALLNQYTVMHYAHEVALTRVPGSSAIDDPAVHKAARNLVLTEDFALVHRLTAYAKDVLGGYEDEQLAALVGHKRVDDYKQALTARNVRGSDSPATYGWIIYQDAKNRAKLGSLPNFDELFAVRSVPDLVS